VTNRTNPDIVQAEHLISQRIIVELVKCTAEPNDIHQSPQICINDDYLLIVAKEQCSPAAQDQQLGWNPMRLSTKLDP
jgi:hypothetical protein